MKCSTKSCKAAAEGAAEAKSQYSFTYPNTCKGSFLKRGIIVERPWPGFCYGLMRFQMSEALVRRFVETLKNVDRGLEAQVDEEDSHWGLVRWGGVSFALCVLHLLTE